MQFLTDSDELRDALLLVFANKSDMPGALPIDQVAKHLGLNKMNQRKWYVLFSTSVVSISVLTRACVSFRFIQNTCAVNGEGLYEGLDWLSSELRKRPTQALH